MSLSRHIRPLAYGLLNIASATGIVFANKAVFSTYGFKFTCALTWIHTVVTLIGMYFIQQCGMFERKAIPPVQIFPLAAAFVGYIVLCNLSLNINTVSFYQLTKIAVAPTVIALEMLLYKKAQPFKVMLAVLVVCSGIALATVTDPEIGGNPLGILVGAGATVVTGLYQIWVSSKQKDLKATSMQLLQAYTPQATIMLGLLIPVMEPVGWQDKKPGTLLGYEYTWPAVMAIFISAILGLLVSLSTFLVIGATSSLTYNVVGHIKTVLILTGACVIFNESMPPKKFLGVCVAMAGIVWYSQLKLSAAAPHQHASPVKPTVTKRASNGPGLPLIVKGGDTSGGPSPRSVGHK